PIGGQERGAQRRSRNVAQRKPQAGDTQQSANQDARCSATHARATSQSEARSGGIVVKHFDRVERVVVEVFANERELLENVVGDGDDVAADFVRLNHVEELTWAGPDQFGSRRRFEDLEGFGHVRYRIATGVGDTPGKDRNV